jgi:hypothetical protein
MPFKAAGSPCDWWPEHLKLNPGSFSTVQAQNSDDWRTQASIGAMPSRTGHVIDTTAYPTQPVEDSWYARVQGTLSPAKVSFGATGTQRQGQLT